LKRRVSHRAPGHGQYRKPRATSTTCEAGNETVLHWIAAIKEHDRDCCGGRLGRRDGIERKYHIHSALDEIGSKRGKLFSQLCFAKFNRYVLTNDEARIGETLLKRGPGKEGS
jgi:hypothetical protein